MKKSKVYVRDRSGRKATGVSVVLCFHGNAREATSPRRTNDAGVAVIEHPESGAADVVVGGHIVGSLKAPGEVEVEI